MERNKNYLLALLSKITINSTTCSLKESTKAHYSKIRVKVTVQ